MADQKKKSLKALAAEIRENVDIPSGMSDRELIYRINDARPDLKIMDMLEPNSLRKDPSKGPLDDANATTRNPEPEGSAASRFGQGLVDPLVSGVQGLVSKSFEEGQRLKDVKARKGSVAAGIETAKQPFRITGELLGGIAKKPAEAIMPGVKEHVAQGDYAGAAGTATTDIAAILSMLKGKGGAGATDEVGKFTALTDRITTPIRDTLNLQGEAIKDAMNGQLSNVASLRGNPIFRKAIAKLQNMETAPGTTKMDVTAAKNALEEMQSQVSSGKATSWNDLFELNKKAKAAGAMVDDATTKSMIRKLTDTVEEELRSGAKNAGSGAQYEQWQKQYAQFSDLRRRYDQLLKGKTDVQMEAKGTAQSTRKQIPGTGIGIGSSKATKIAKTNAELIKQSHKAFEQLHTEIKAAPKVKPSGQPPAPPTPPPVAPQAPVGGSPAQAPPTPAPAPAQQTPQWPTNYTNAPKNLSSMGGGGANYSAADLEAFKKKHGI